MAVIHINYEEGNQKEYHSVSLSMGDGGEITFDSGDFVKDWFNLIKKISTDEKIESPIIYSSSVNHFISDGDAYQSAHLHVIDGKPILKYSGEENIEFFVKSNTTPTWEELKEICK